MSSTSKGSTRRTDAVANRARILQAALQVFAERGLELEMNEVAARAHLGVATLYGHFANREELLRAILRSVIEDTLDQLQRAQASSIENPLTAFEEFVKTGVRLQDQYRPLAGVLRDLRLIELMEPSYISQVRERFLEVPKLLITSGIQKGVFYKELDLDMAAVIIMGAFISVMDLFETSTSLEELVKRLTHSLLILLTVNTDKSKTV